GSTSSIWLRYTIRRTRARSASRNKLRPLTGALLQHVYQTAGVPAEHSQVSCRRLIRRPQRIGIQGAAHEHAGFAGDLLRQGRTSHVLDEEATHLGRPRGLDDASHVSGGRLGLARQARKRNEL